MFHPHLIEDATVLADKERLMLKIFHDYYVRNMSQSEIAARHFVSRQKVQRFLEQGRNDNLVEVRIKFPERMHGRLESELEDKYGLLEVIVADVDPEYNHAMLRRDVAEFAADYFLRVLSRGMVISMCWSTFIAEMTDVVCRKVASLREKPADIDIVQSLGAIIDNDPEFQVYDSSRRLAASLNARLHLIMAPGIAASTGAYHALMDDPQIAGVLELARRSDAAFFGIGSVDGESNLMRSLARVMPAMIPELKRHGVVGDLNGRFFCMEGNPIESELDERLIGLSLDEVKALPLAVGVTGGPEKYEALRAAVVGGLVKTVVTDINNARRLVEDKTFGERPGDRKAKRRDRS